MVGRGILLLLAALGCFAVACGAYRSSGVPVAPEGGGGPVMSAPLVSRDPETPAAAAAPAPVLVPPAVHEDPQRELSPAPSANAPRVRTDAATPPSINAAAYLVMDDASGAVLLHDNGHVPLPPASLTKIATAIVAIEHGDLDQWVTNDVDSRVMRGSTVMGLIPGDQFTLRDLLYGMIL